MNPYERGDEDACKYCSYKKVCGFDPAIPGYQKRKLAETEQEELLRKMAGTDNVSGTGSTVGTDRETGTGSIMDGENNENEG